MVGKLPSRTENGVCQRNGEGGERSRGNANGITSQSCSSISIDMNLPSPQMEAQVRDVCRTFIKKWCGLGDGNFKVEKVSGGITNLLLKVSAVDEHKDEYCITVRVYGPNTDVVIDRGRELQAAHYLSAAGFGPKLLGIFANGMVQSFIDARTLDPADMRRPKLAAELARQLHKFHQLEVPGPKDPQLWPDILKFLDKASHLKFDDCKKQEMYSSIPFWEIGQEINNLKSVTERLDAPVVFAHNDLLSGNLMLCEKEEKLYLIDFEYGSYSYRGYDIGNHFNEYAGFDCDFDVYPNVDTQYHFFRHYLSPEHPECVSEAELKKLYVETNVYSLASHLYWALWAIVQAKYSPIEFDYLHYFQLRYDEYKKQKRPRMLLAETYNSTG